MCHSVFCLAAKWFTVQWVYDRFFQSCVHCVKCHFVQMTFPPYFSAICPFGDMSFRSYVFRPSVLATCTHNWVSWNRSMAQCRHLLQSWHDKHLTKLVTSLMTGWPRKEVIQLRHCQVFSSVKFAFNKQTQWWQYPYVRVTHVTLPLLCPSHTC